MRQRFGLLSVCPLHALQQVDKVTPLNAEEATPYVGEALRQLRAEVRSCNAAGDGHPCLLGHAPAV